MGGDEWMDKHKRADSSHIRERGFGISREAWCTITPSHLSCTWNLPLGLGDYDYSYHISSINPFSFLILFFFFPPQNRKQNFAPSKKSSC